MASPIVGHENVLAFLRRTVNEGRPAHAYLFTGREGVGKKLVAVRLACMLNCVDPEHDLDVSSCAACRKILRGTHPDLTYLQPEKGGIRIEKIRELQDFFRYAPVEGNYRVAIVDNAHRMNGAAQNALLKTLEEPPPGRLLVLVTARPSGLLATVRSRCRKVRFGPIPVEALAAFLNEQKGIPPEKARALAGLSGGSVSAALELDSSSFLEVRDKLVAFLTDPGKLGLRGILELSSEMSLDREQAVQALESVMVYLRDLLVLMQTGDTAAVIHRDLLDRISSSAQHQNYEVWFSVYDALLKAVQLIEADTNLNLNLVMDVLLLKTARMLAGPTLGITAGAGNRE